MISIFSNTHFKSLMISAAAMIAVVIPQWLGAVDFGAYTPVIQAAAGVLVNAIQRWVSAQGGATQSARAQVGDVEITITGEAPAPNPVIDAVAAIKADLAADKARAEAEAKRRAETDAAIKSLASA